MKIEIGEYIRTKQGDISKVRYVDEENIFLEDDVWSINDLYEKTNILYFDDEEIAKHSKNIIDLIEVGDYVNGVEVIDLADGIHLEFANDVSYVDVGLATYRDGHIEGIETIVTKEQFNNMEYRL